MRLPIAPSNPAAARLLASLAAAATLTGWSPALPAPLAPSAIARPALLASATAATAPTTDKTAPATPQTVADEAWALLDKYYLDRTFNGIDWAAERKRLAALPPMSPAQSSEEAQSLVARLGDRYSRVLGAQAAAKLLSLIHI